MISFFVVRTKQLNNAVDLSEICYMFEKISTNKNILKEQRTCSLFIQAFYEAREAITSISLK